MKDTLWIGGSPCCGKSSIAEILRDRFGLNYYKCDDHFDRHLQQGAADGRPISQVLQRVTHEYVFMRSHQENVRLAFQVYREEMEYILQDIEDIARPLLVEGCALLPESLDQLGVERALAVYMVPVEGFFRGRYSERTWAWDRLQETSDPEQAFENWMRRDVEFARRVSEDAQRRGYRVITVDGSASINETAESVIRHFRLDG